MKIESSEKNKISIYDKFREFVINTTENCKDESYEYSKRYSRVKKLNYEIWRVELPEYGN